MKLISYTEKSKEKAWRIGCLHEETIIDLQDAYQKLLSSKAEKNNASAIESIFPADPTLFFKAGKQLLDEANAAYTFALQHIHKVKTFSRSNVKLGTPIPDPGKIICVGRNYKEHAEEMKGKIPEYPVLFAKFSNALIGPEDAIEKTRFTEKLDYEVELVVIIGKEASCVRQEDALDYIAGYTIGNDTSARDLQKRTLQWLQGKTLDRSTPIGPWVISADQIGDPASLSVKSYVNGEERQASTTDKLIFSIPFLVSFISNIMTLEPGDIIMTGTPEGVGTAMTPPQYLQPGDVVGLEIENIGCMENKVIEK